MRVKIAILLLSLLIMGLLLLRIWVLIELESYDLQYHQIEDELTIVKDENMTLDDLWLSESALGTVEWRAKTEGFVDAKKLFY